MAILLQKSENLKNKKDLHQNDTVNQVRAAFKGSTDNCLSWTKIESHVYSLESEGGKKVKEKSVGTKVDRCLKYLTKIEEIEQNENGLYCLTKKGRNAITPKKDESYIIEMNTVGVYMPNDSYWQYKRKARKLLLNYYEPIFRAQYQEWCFVTNSPEKWDEPKVSRYKKKR